MLKKLGLILAPKDIKDIIEMTPEAIERVLLTLRYKIEYYLARKKNKRVESAGLMKPPSRPAMQQMMGPPVVQNLG